MLLYVLSCMFTIAFIFERLTYNCKRISNLVSKFEDIMILNLSQLKLRQYIFAVFVKQSVIQMRYATISAWKDSRDTT